ncbi:MAG: type II secretion system F family protein [Bacilli bacterium]|nr:type II secretion system F family protein [Bacilli bacterium]
MNKQNNVILEKIYREEDINEIKRKLNLLGSTKKMDAVTFLNLRLITLPFVFILCLYLFNFGYIIAPLITTIYYFVFTYLVLDHKIKLRGEKLEREALNFFEILTLTLESGRNLERALTVTCDNVNSELSNEFKLALLEMRFGKSLIEALDDLKYKIPSETVNNIILNITQTSVFGSGILETMYNQVEFLRDKRILKIKEQINKIPNKVSIISVVFVVPLILLLILSPFIINFLNQ